MESNVFNIDCLDYMKTLPDKFFELAIVDPPYGNNMMRKNKHQRHRIQDSGYRNKSIPSHEFFDELARVSIDSIIWGCQYMIPFMNPNGSFIIWDKKIDPDLHNMSAVDVAWYSKRSRIRKFTGIWCGACKCEQEPTIHIHQKPISLYKWLLKHYAKPGDKIFDSHMGSQSSRIAADIMGFDFYGCELDPVYLAAGNKRFEQHKSQLNLF